MVSITEYVLPRIQVFTYIHTYIHLFDQAGKLHKMEAKG